MGEVDGAARTPFAVVTRFEPTIDARVEGPLEHAELLAALDELIPAGAASCAIRLDGRFELVRARSVPRQSPPYRPLTEVVAEQHVFELRDVAGTMLGFRFPDYAEGIEVSGYHLHFISDGPRRAAGTCSAHAAHAACAPASTPPATCTSSCRRGSSWPTRGSPPSTHAAVELVERGS